MKELLLEEFKQQKTILNDFNKRVVSLVTDLLRQDNLIVHQISGRTKDVDSLDKKIDKKQGKYKSLNDITDLVGIRIITYLESDVDTVSELLSKEFNIDVPNSTDKRILKSDQFGYKSLHVVCELNENRCALKEYISYKGIKCEIQIRSILQHAWAEIEHDLGYKGKSSIPDEYKRNFNRLAALLETADKEFDRLKSELSKYEKEISKLIKEEPQSVELNQASLISLIASNHSLNEAKLLIAKNSGATFYEETDMSGMIARFKLFNINNIKELEDSLLLNQKVYLSFVNIFTENTSYKQLSSSLSLFYFQHFLAAKSENSIFVQEYFDYEEPFIGGPDLIATNSQFVDIYLRAKQSV